MAVLPIIPNIFRVTINWADLGGATGKNVMHFSGPSKDSQDVADALTANTQTNQFQGMSTTAAALTATILPLDGVTPGADYSLGTSWQGQTASDYMTAPAVIIKHVTAVRGRSGRGRIYLPFVAETQQNAGRITPGSVTNMTGAWVAFANAMEADGIALGVASYTESIWRQSINIACESALGTQRRRQQRVRSF